MGALVPAAARAAGPQTTLTISNMTFVSSRSGTSEVIVHAAEARTVPEESKVLLEKMDVKMTSTADASEFWMNCDQGELFFDSNDFMARGNVRAGTADGRRLETDWAYFEDAKGLVSTEAPVLMVEQTGVLRGGGFQYWVGEARLLVTGGATMTQEGSEK